MNPVTGFTDTNNQNQYAKQRHHIAMCQKHLPCTHFLSIQTFSSANATFLSVLALSTCLLQHTNPPLDTHIHFL